MDSGIMTIYRKLESLSDLVIEIVIKDTIGMTNTDLDNADKYCRQRISNSWKFDRKLNESLPIFLISQIIIPIANA